VVTAILTDQHKRLLHLASKEIFSPTMAKACLFTTSPVTFIKNEQFVKKRQFIKKSSLTSYVRLV
jgi:hypothetical protein